MAADPGHDGSVVSDSSLLFELREGTLTFDLAVDVLHVDSPRPAALTVSVDLAIPRARLRLTLGDDVTEVFLSSR